MLDFYFLKMLNYSDSIDLKKLYYLIHNEEIEGQDGKSATLANAIHAFSCLWNLKNAKSDEAKKYSEYLQKVRDWRNDNTHNAPTTSEKEIDEAIQVVVAMYLYVTGNSITDLEMAGFDVESATIKPIRSEDRVYPKAADPLIPHDPD